MPAIINETNQVTINGATPVLAVSIDQGKVIHRVRIKTRSGTGWVGFTANPTPRNAGWYVGAVTGGEGFDITNPGQPIYIHTNADVDTTTFCILVTYSKR